MDFDEHLESARARPCGQVRDERQRLRDHEAAGARLLDGETCGVDANRADARRLEALEDRVEIPAAFGMMDVDVDLLGRERGPEQDAFAVRCLVLRERQAGTDRVEREQIGFAGAPRKDAREGQEQARIRRRLATRVEVDELRRTAGDVVDDHVGHDLGARRQRPHVVPGAEPRIHLGVIDRVEAGVGAVDRIEEGQDVHAAERLAQRAVEQALRDRGRRRRTADRRTR